MSYPTNKNLPIGIFDSGMGGLTVLRALQNTLPHENFIYLGDTARLPYGTKSAETVREYALNACDVFMQRGVKAIVVACNTATGPALPALQEKFHPIPVIGVILPGVNAILSGANPQGPYVVLATEGTVKWHAYRDALTVLDPSRKIMEWPCSLLVALAEEGWCEGELVQNILRRLLQPLFDTLQGEQPACLLLGCTHFPVFADAIRQVVPNIPVIDPATMVAQQLKSLLSIHEIESSTNEKGTVEFLATDGIERFARVAPIFLGYDLKPEQVQLVALDFSEQRKKKAS
jgi:glutamate racemase